MDIRTILSIVIIVALIVAVVIYFINLPREKQIQNLKEWLKWAVVEAEKALGSGTGQLKLRMVYDMAVKQFPWVSTLIPFDVFSKWVDEALDWMREQLEKDENIKNYTTLD